MDHPKHKVLIIDDSKYQQSIYQKELADNLQILPAFSIEEGRALFSANPDIAIIVMDACVPGDSPTTAPLVQEFRKTFTGPMIAASSALDFREGLMRAGCDLQAEKGNVPSTVLKLVADMLFKAAPSKPIEQSVLNGDVHDTQRAFAEESARQAFMAGSIEDAGLALKSPKKLLFQPALHYN